MSRGPEFACEIWVESSLAGEMRVITRWHRAMCLCPVPTLILHSAETRIPLSHAREAYCIPQMSSSFGRGVTGHRLCEDLGTLRPRSRLRQGFDSLSQTKRCSCKATWFSLPQTHCQQSAWSIQACGARLASKTGVCSTTIPQTKKVKRGSSRLDDCSHSTLSALCFSPPFCLFFFLSLSAGCLIICYLSLCPLSLFLPHCLSLSQPICIHP